MNARKIAAMTSTGKNQQPERCSTPKVKRRSFVGRSTGEVFGGREVGFLRRPSQLSPRGIFPLDGNSERVFQSRAVFHHRVLANDRARADEAALANRDRPMINHAVLDRVAQRPESVADARVVADW